MISGAEILVRTISIPRPVGGDGNIWNYHSRSDHHSKVACWGIVFDLLRNSPLLRAHVEAGKVGFGINVMMTDFRNDRKKKLDLVICQPASGSPLTGQSLDELGENYRIDLSPTERLELERIPTLRQTKVGSVLVALEAKACMTAHQKSLPRLYDELNSSHLIVHGASDYSIAAGFVMINGATQFLSPILNSSCSTLTPRWTSHAQPRCVDITMDTIRKLPRRSQQGMAGYDALSMVIIDCKNDGSAVTLVSDPPAPAPGDQYYYPALIDRIINLYGSRYAHL